MGSLKKAAKGYTNRQRWDASFQNDMFKIPEGRATKIRLLPEVATVPTHWVEFYSKKKQGLTGFYELCLNWDYENDEQVDNGCPMCEKGLRASNYVYGYVISRAEQKKGNLQIRPVRLTPKCTNDIIKLTDIAYPDEEWPEGWDGEDGGPDATDAKFGFDVMISRESKNNKIEYPVHVATNGQCALTKEELRAFRDYHDSINVGELAKAGILSVNDARQMLSRLGVEDAEEEGGEKSGGKGGEKSGKKRDYNSYDDDVPGDGDGDDDDDSDPVAPASSAKKPAGKAAAAGGKTSGKTSSKPAAGGKAAAGKTAARQAASLTDDDEGDERSMPWDDEDGEQAEQSYAAPDDDDAPDEEADED